MNTHKETIIGMPPGIGDLHWIMAKLESFKEKNDIQNIKVIMNLGRRVSENFHDCSLEYLDLIPFVNSAESTMDSIDFEYALDGGSGTPLLYNLSGCDYLIEFNSQLENGVFLKNILPEYDTNFDYPIFEPQKSRIFANEIKKSVGGKLVLLYTSGVGANEAWVKELWTPRDWAEFAWKIHAETKCRPIIIGARWDSEYAERVLAYDHDRIILDLTGKTSVAHLFALLREANIVIGFQCGVIMTATKFRTPVVGFWPIKSKANPKGIFKRSFTRTWLPPWADDVGFLPYGWGDKGVSTDGIFEAIRRYL